MTNMGCDIHMVVEKRINGTWTRVEELPPRVCSWCDGRGHYKDRPEAKCYWCVEKEGSVANGMDCRPYGDRNYTVFSVLANVRNDGNVTAICEPRGLPEDATHSTGEDAEYEYGDHSFSWLTLSQLLAYDWKQTISDEGFVDAEKFKKWDDGGGIGHPDSWCSSVGGGAVVHVSNSEMRRRLDKPYPWEASDHPYTLAKWTVSLTTYCKHFLSFMETLCGVGEPDDVRIVFGFDS